LISFALIFATSLLLFENFGTPMPVVGPWIALVGTFILGMGDRLDRRERREWNVEREAENLQSLDEMRTNFLSLVSHDLKTPVARLLANLDRLLSGDFDPLTSRQRDTIQKLISASGDLQRTISTLLLLGRIESRDFKILRTPTDLNEVLHDSITGFGNLAADRSIEMIQIFEPLFLVDLDRDLLIQVVNNLIDNALKYSPIQKKVFIRSGETEYARELTPPGSAIWFEVQDEGPGIPPDERGKVLEKFVRGAKDITNQDRSITGTGLGLYLARFFVEKHGGVIQIFSRIVNERPQDGLNPSSDYFSENTTGTVIRVILPIDAPIIEVG
jgi:signal transduction histidine kinase